MIEVNQAKAGLFVWCPGVCDGPVAGSARMPNSDILGGETGERACVPKIRKTTFFCIFSWRQKRVTIK